MEDDEEFSTKEKIDCVVHWYQTWNTSQRCVLLQDLIESALPCKMDDLLVAMEDMKLNQSTQNVFNYQMQLYKRWFQKWSAEEKNFFLEKLESCDPVLISSYYSRIQSDST